jgi:hypothetical protein
VTTLREYLEARYAEESADLPGHWAPFELEWTWCPVAVRQAVVDDPSRATMFGDLLNDEPCTCNRDIAVRAHILGVDSKRAVLKVAGGQPAVLTALGLAYADRPDYDPAWLPPERDPDPTVEGPCEG